MTPADRSELLQGTLELLVLKTLSLEPMHGWGISQRIRQMSREVLDVPQGSLYPALQRMKRKGWIRSEWRVTEHNRRARYYLLTPAGERQLEAERAAWDRSSSAVNWVLGWQGGTA
ncbi:MAG TPA: PadR family transcriptional regulator [Longimicrobiales bacterium]|nr:PadR family transcriptional regulator [Longimicrobiales bacterium]